MKQELLLVDDDETMLYLHERILEKCKITLPSQSFKNGKEVFDYLQNNQEKGKVFLILLDIYMPIMNGWDFLEALSKQAGKNKVYVVIISSSLELEDLEKSQKYTQVIDYLEKPIKSELMMRLMQHDKLKDFSFSN